MLSAASPFSLTIFGASGHLAKIKLYPALYFLALKERLPSDYAIVGYSRTAMDDESFRTLVREALLEHVLEVNNEVMEEFLSHCFYVTGQYDSADDYQVLANKLTTLEESWSDATRLAYFSVPPSVFASVSKNLCAGNVHTADIPLRCIVEKPVGNDLESFEEIRKQLLGCFQEDDIYLLDHYLGKEAVRNVYYLRFANPVLERLAKNTLIDHVEITAFEAAGLEGRAGYFEHTGTFRDMVQSHLLEVASLLTMRLKETDDGMRESRIDALSQFYLPPATSLDDVVLQGQYGKGSVQGKEVVGYRDEDDIPAGSHTNTYAALKLHTRISKWEGVPFYLRSGKRLEKKETRISIQFQEPHSIGKGATPNRLDIIMQGEAGMRLHLQTKLGGIEPEFRPLVMEDPLVCVGDCLPEHSLMLLEAIHGRKQWFLSFDEVQKSWRLLDPIQKHLDNPKTPLYEYTAGTTGPAEAEAWIEKDGREWYG